MTSQNDNEEFLKQFVESTKRRAERLAEAKRVAAEVGKEPFDLDRFNQYYSDHNTRLYSSPREERIAELEEIYYVRHPKTMTLEEFAKKMDELDMYE